MIAFAKCYSLFIFIEIMDLHSTVSEQILFRLRLSAKEV